MSSHNSIFVPADEVGRGHRNGERPCVCASVRPSVRGSLSLSGKVITQSISNLMHAFVEWVFRTFGPCWPNFGPLVAKKITVNGSKCWFLTIISKSTHTIQFKLVVYTCWVSVQNRFTFGPRGPNCGPLVATKWLKMMVSGKRNCGY